MNENDKKRTNIEDIPRAEEELTDDEAKDVQGGLIGQKGALVSLGGTNVSSPGTTVGGSLSIDPSNPSRKMGDGSV